MTEPTPARAVVATAYGGPEVLRVTPIEVPVPGPGRVLVEVRAAGVNVFDTKVYSGALGTDPARLPLRLGTEVAGVVAAVGPDSPHEVGAEVIAFPVSGGYATHVLARDAAVFPKPGGLTFAQASGLMQVGATAVHLLEATGVGAGDVVLLHGASGGVGTAVVQLAVARGATVIGTASERRLAAVRALGATAVRYGEGLADRVRQAAPSGVDVALDTAGTDEAVDVSLALVADRSRIATIVAFGRADTGIQVLGGADDPGTAIRDAARADLVSLAGQRRLAIPVDRTFLLDDAGAAHTHLLSGRAAGKIVLLP